jgi:putative addiction module killer protein
MIDTFRAGRIMAEIEVRQTEVFASGFETLRDRRARLKIQVRIDRLAAGNRGLAGTLKGGVSELKIDYGPGFRIYYTQPDPVLIVLLCGGDKSSQSRDIQAAIDPAQQL